MGQREPSPERAPLGYGRPKNRRWQRVVVLAVVLAAVAGGVVHVVRPVVVERYRKWRDHRATLAAMAKEHARATAFQNEFLRKQSEGMTYTPPNDWVAYEEDPDRAASLLKAHPDYRRAPRHPSVQWDVAPDYQPPVVFSPSVLHRLEIPSLGPLFLHERHKPDGTPRLVMIGYRFRPYRDGGRLIEIGANATIPADETLYSWRRPGERWNGQLRVALRPDDRLRIFWGRPDPHDASRFSLEYDLNGERGRVGFRLAEQEIKLEHLDGAAPRGIVRVVSY